MTIIPLTKSNMAIIPLTKSNMAIIPLTKSNMAIIPLTRYSSIILIPPLKLEHGDHKCHYTIDQSSHIYGFNMTIIPLTKSNMAIIPLTKSNMAIIPLTRYSSIILIPPLKLEHGDHKCPTCQVDTETCACQEPW